MSDRSNEAPRLSITAAEAEQAIATAAGGLVGEQGSGLVSPDIAAMAPYRPPKPWRLVAEELGLPRSELMLLAANENVLGPSARALEAAQRAVGEEAHLYPDGGHNALRAALAERHAVSPEHVVIGNGSSEIIELLVRTFMAEGQTMVTSWPSFVVYRLVAQAAGREALIAPLRNDHHDLGAIAALVDARTRLVFIANPNNPTGTYLPRRELAAFLDRIPRSVIVVLDEAYSEFADAENYPDGIRDFGHHPNLVVLRTFSKAFGLAGLRVGYGVMHPRLVYYLDCVRQPYNVNVIGQAAARVALEDHAHLRASQRLVRDGRAQLATGLERLGLKVLPSQANFVAVKLACGATEVTEGLRKAGVFVRDLSAYELPDTIRVTVGTKAQNIALLEQLGRHLAGA